jgi:predicted porin
VKLRFGAITFAALASTLAAHAQTDSSVQLYGALTASLVHKTNQTGGRSTNELANGLLFASHFGVRGTENLGGGMSAVYRLESTISPDTGASGATVGTTAKFWNRQSFVGLNVNPVVSVTMGRQFHAAVDRVIRTFDVYQLAGTSLHVTPLALFGVNRFAGNDGRSDDSIKVRANGPMGLHGGLSVGLDDGTGRSYSFDAAQVTPAYSIGAVGVRYRSPTVVAATGVRPEHVVWGFGGNVPVGPVRAYLMYMDSKLESATAGRLTQTNKIIHVGANWQATPQTAVRAAYYRDKGRAMNGIAGRDGTKETWVLSGEYYLSKRTSLNAAAFSNSFSGGYKLDPVNIAGLSRDAASASTQGATVGIRHDF